MNGQVFIIQALLLGNNKNNECNMRDIKPELISADRRSTVVLQNIPQHQGLVVANRFLVLLVFVLVIVVFVLGFLLVPSNNMLDNLKASQKQTTATYAVQNPVLSAEIDSLKSQFVGLISGSIESKLRMLELSVRMGSVTASLGTIEDLRNDVQVLQTYSVPEKKAVKSQGNEALLVEVSQLKNLIYFTLTSCGLMIAAIGGFWIRNHFRLDHQGAKKRATLGKKE